MPYKYSLLAVAQEDYESSISWYIKRSLTASKKFVNVIDKSLATICSDPKRQRNEYENYYEFTVQEYPFTIVYTIEESLKRILVVAIYHQKRNPEHKYR
jgi:plasmid stabilization system protein ParE